MIRIHKEGKKMLAIAGTIVVLVNLLVAYFAPSFILLTSIVSTLLFLAILQFFRDPVREIQVADDKLVYAPADGKIVTIEETTESEYFNDRRIQVSIFMSPTNVHVNRNPIGGKVNYYKYHEGKYLVAWHPKSSTENERTTVVIDNGQDEILLRQIAGALAKRIVNYLEIGEEVEQGEDMGFIKFGSRVDLFLPLDVDLQVEVGQKVRGNETIIAKI